MLRCLVCYSDLSPRSKVKSADDIRTGQEEDVSGGGGDGGFEGCGLIKKTILSEHLDVIFILRNIFQVPVTQLSNYLKNCPRVDNWIGICEKCNELVRDYRGIYGEVVEISRKVEELKGGIIGIVKKSYQSCEDKPRRRGEEDSSVFLNITDECRRFINDYEYQWPINPFIDGDLQAQQLLDKQNLNDNQDKPVSISKKIKTGSKPKNDLVVTPTPNLTTSNYSDDDNDNDPFSNDNDGFEPEEDNFNFEDNDDDEPKLNANQNSTRRSLRKPKSDEWKPPTYLKKDRPPFLKQECPHCPSSSEIFTTFSQLDAHFKDNHPNELPPKQRKYPAEYYTVSDTRKRRVRSKVPSQCPHCSKQLSSHDSLRKHIQFTHLLKFLYKCATCGVGKPSKKSLETHEALCMESGPPEKCPEEGCSVVVSRLVGLETHFRDKHRERTLFSKCSECGEGFYTELGLKRHLETKHKEIRPFKCEECGMGFKFNHGLKKHKILRHGGDVTKDAICDHCGAGFRNEANLRDHVKRMHETEFTLRCDQCGRGFWKEEFLKVHLFKKHGVGRVEDLKWRCEVEGCGRVFWMRGPLEAHLKWHEGKGAEFTCEECGKQFYQKFHLTYHWKAIHESKLKEEIFKCEICGAEFGFKDYLRRHKRTVHKIFPKRR